MGEGIGLGMCKQMLGGWIGEVVGFEAFGFLVDGMM